MGTVRISKTDKFKAICEKIRFLIADRNLLTQKERAKFTDKHIFWLFIRADILTGSPVDIFSSLTGCEKTDNLAKVLSTQYLLYVVLCRSNGIKIGRAQ